MGMLTHLVQAAAGPTCIKHAIVDPLPPMLPVALHGWQLNAQGPCMPWKCMQEPVGNVAPYQSGSAAQAAQQAAAVVLKISRRSVPCTLLFGST